MNKSALLIALGTALSLASCGTVSGIGQDLQKGGQAIEQSAGSQSSY